MLDFDLYEEYLTAMHAYTKQNLILAVLRKAKIDNKSILEKKIKQKN